MNILSRLIIAIVFLSTVSISHASIYNAGQLSPNPIDNSNQTVIPTINILSNVNSVEKATTLPGSVTYNSSNGIFTINASSSLAYRFKISPIENYTFVVLDQHYIIYDEEMNEELTSNFVYPNADGYYTVGYDSYSDSIHTFYLVVTNNGPVVNQTEVEHEAMLFALSGIFCGFLFWGVIKKC